MFVQGARGPDRAEGGLGLGLSLVRTLTELHGGTVSAHSDGLGRGSEFTVRLPASARRSSQPFDAAAVPAAAAARGQPRDLRVLVVDDNRDGADHDREPPRARRATRCATANDPSRGAGAWPRPFSRRWRSSISACR